MVMKSLVFVLILKFFSSLCKDILIMTSV